MLSRKSRWLVVFVVFLALMTWGFFQPLEARAAANLDSTENSCLTCHEDLYYLYDTGCWYCMTDAHKDRCVDCHEGDPSAYKEEAAHLGLEKHPQENSGEKCLECHTPEEKEIVLATFETAHGGFDTVIRAEPYIPLHSVVVGFPAKETSNRKIENAGWLVFGFLMFGLWLILVTRTQK